MEQNKSPSILNQASSLATAVINWAKEDFAKVPAEVLESRLSICLQCPHWDKSAFAGIGKCQVCGCSAGKLYMPHSKCPLPEPKWFPYQEKNQSGSFSV
jgi:hypothetical protein